MVARQNQSIERLLVTKTAGIETDINLDAESNDPKPKEISCMNNVRGGEHNYTAYNGVK